MANDNQTTQLEPRVAKLETGLEMLTRDVASLANIVREQGSGIEEQIKQLAIGVTQAAGPRRTDWGTLIAAIMLIMAIGSAVFWPLNQTAQNNKEEIKALEAIVNDHEKLANHPVGSALIDRIESEIKGHIALNERTAKEHEEMDIAKFKELDLKLQKEATLLTDKAVTMVADLEKRQTMFNEKLYNRVVELERAKEASHEKDLDELRQWRNKANGLSGPDSVVPLRPRENGVK